MFLLATDKYRQPLCGGIGPKRAPTVTKLSLWFHRNSGWLGDEPVHPSSHSPPKLTGLPLGLNVLGQLQQCAPSQTFSDRTSVLSLSLSLPE